MARRSPQRTKRQGYARLLDAWVPPDGAGDPIGVVSTTFTFDAAFFEEECLARFLGLESDPAEDGPVYLIEREEKLAGVRCATVLADQHHCRGMRSLRWDLLPVHIDGGGVLHAKVSLLCWARLIRIIVTSANLTLDGYRRNQEIFGVLDFGQPGGDDPALLETFTSFLRSLVENERAEASAIPASGRLLGLLDYVARFGAELPDRTDERKRAQVNVMPVFSGPGREDVFTQLKALWPEGMLPSVAVVTSPFFDPPEAPNRPAQALWELLRPRSEARITFNVVAEEIPGGSAFVINAPRGLLDAQPAGRHTVSTRFCRIPTQDEGDESKGMFRPVHLKSLWLQGTYWAAYLIGSSNFTSAGTGLGRSANLEANLIYRFRHDVETGTSRAMDAARLEGELLPDNAELRWESPADEEIGETEALEVLPRGFITAIYEMDAMGDATIALHLTEKGLPLSWSISEPLQNNIVFESNDWKAQGRQKVMRVSWHELAPPSGFEVQWPGSRGSAWLPVIVKDAASLPPPDELKNLPLELLIQVLTSSRPLYEVMRRWLRHRGNREHSDTEALDSDPHGRVDTSSFLLQRTRRLSWALEALKSRLALPAATCEALNWRLRGPVGVQSLASAIAREAVSVPERSFLICELALSLARVEPCDSPGCLPVDEVRAEIKGVIREMWEELREGDPLEIKNLAQYVEKAFSTAMS